MLRGPLAYKDLLELMACPDQMGIQAPLARWEHKAHLVMTAPQVRQEQLEQAEVPRVLPARQEPQELQVRKGQPEMMACPDQMGIPAPQVRQDLQALRDSLARRGLGEELQALPDPQVLQGLMEPVAVRQVRPVYREMQVIMVLPALRVLWVLQVSWGPQVRKVYLVRWG